MQRQKRMALINDITGFGRCSIAAMAPIVSAMKIQAVPIPTAILSTHTQFPIFYFDDYTSRMSDYIQTYKDLHLEFDAIATGFLGSKEQVDIVIDFIQTFKQEGVFVLVDPVMGDHGKLYTTYTPEMCAKMKQLVQYADLMTPNLTELVTLVDRPYPTTLPTFDELEEIHNKMETLLGKEGAYLDAIYYCPHHPHKGYEGERPELKIECKCRKPKPGMLLKAAEEFNIDLSQSWMIGDGENDVIAGINAGCKTVLLSDDDKNYGQTETMKSLDEFTKSLF